MTNNRPQFLTAFVTATELWHYKTLGFSREKRRLFFVNGTAAKRFFCIMIFFTIIFTFRSGGVMQKTPYHDEEVMRRTPFIFKEASFQQVRTHT